MSDRPTPIQTIRSHAGLARYLARLGRPIGHILRDAIDVPSPYASGPTWRVHRGPDGRPLILSETSHRCYQAFLVPDPTPIYRREREAMKTRALGRTGDEK